MRLLEWEGGWPQVNEGVVFHDKIRSVTKAGTPRGEGQGWS